MNQLADFGLSLQMIWIRRLTAICSTLVCGVPVVTCSEDNLRVFHPPLGHRDQLLPAFSSVQTTAGRTIQIHQDPHRAMTILVCL